MGGGGAGDAGFGGGAGRHAAAEAVDPVREVEQLAVGPVVEVGALAAGAENHFLGLALAVVVRVELVSPAVDVEGPFGAHELDARAAAGVGEGALEVHLDAARV